MRLTISILFLLLHLACIGQSQPASVTVLYQTDLAALRPERVGYGSNAAVRVLAGSPTQPWATGSRLWRSTFTQPAFATNTAHSVTIATNAAYPRAAWWISEDHASPIQDATWYGAPTNAWRVDAAGNLYLGTTNVTEYLASISVSIGSNIPVVPTIPALAARAGNSETVLVLDAGSFSDSTGNAAFLVHYPASSAPTNETDTLAALPSGRWIVRRISAEPEAFLHTDDRLTAWVESSSFSITNAQANASGVVTNAGLRWPDGSSGTYTATGINSTFGSVDAFQFTHAKTGKTLAQPLVGRDANGAVTNKPSITITPPGDVFEYPFTNYIGGAGYYATLAGFAAATNNFTMVFIGADTNGIPGLWVRGIGSGTVDGANYAADAAGVQVKRIQ